MALRVEDMVDDDYYTPGQVVPPGRYSRVDASPARVIVLDTAGRLPASLDGRVALYRRLPDFSAKGLQPPVVASRRFGRARPAYA